MIEIILATYNGERFLKEQIDSILNQSYRDIKLYIRDDGSRDHTVYILREYQKKDSRVVLIEDKKGNLGYVNNFFELLSYTKREFVLFSDQDDVWEETKVEKMLKVATFELHLEGKSTPLLVHHDVIITDAQLKGNKLFLRRKGVQEGIEYFFFQNIVQSAAMLINRPLIEILKKRPENIIFHDKYIHILAELFGKRSFVPESLMLYRQHGENSVGQESHKEKMSKFNENQGRVFLPWEREAYLFILQNFTLSDENRKKVNQYLFITDMTLPKKERLKILKKSSIKIPYKKRLAMKWFGK